MGSRASRIIRNRRPLGSALLLFLAASCVPAGTATRPLSAGDADPAAAALAGVAPPPAVPLVLQPVAPDTAMALNAAIPIADVHNPAARSFTLQARSMLDRLRSIDCLTQAIYYEAASESDDGQRAVAQVVLNRLRHPSYPNSVCGVVYQGSERTTGCQFTFTCDGSLMRTPSIAGWARARRIAGEALAGRVFEPVGHATHYHTHQVLPYWAASLVKSAVIGAHIFYRFGGAWGQPPAFRQTYAGVEPFPAPKPRPVLPLPAITPAFLQADLAALAPAPSTPWHRSARVASPEVAPADDKLPKVVYQGSGLPDSQVLEAYRYSGVPRDELPDSATAAGR